MTIFSFPSLCLFQCGEESGILATLDNMGPYVNYAKEAQTMISQSLAPPTGKGLPQPVDVKDKVIQLVTTSIVAANETTETAARVTKFDVARYRHEGVLHMFNQNNDLETPLFKISGFFFVQCFRANGSDHGRGTPFVTTTATATASEPCEGAPSCITHILDGAAYMARLDRRHRLQALHEPQNAVDIA